MKTPSKQQRVRIGGSHAIFLVLACVACVAVDPGPVEEADARDALPMELDDVRTVTEDADPERRLEALDRIQSPALLLWLATRSEHEDVAQAAAQRLVDEVAFELALRERPALAPALLPRVTRPRRLARILIEVRLRPDLLAPAVDRLPAGPLLLEVARRAPLEVRRLAIDRLTDPRQLEQLAFDAESALERAQATRRVADPTALQAIATQDPSVEVRMEAVKRIQDQQALELIARGEDVAAVRLEALLRIESRAVLSALEAQGASAPTPLADGAAHESFEPVGTLGADAVGRATLATVAGWVLALRAPQFATQLETRYELLSGDERVAVEVRAGPTSILRVELDQGTNLIQPLGRLLDALELSPSELSQLSRHPSKHLKRACLQRSLPSADVHRLATTDALSDVRRSAVNRLDPEEDLELLVRIACDDPADGVAFRALDRIQDGPGLGRVALEARNRAVRRRATLRVTDPDVLARISIEDPRPENRSAAIRGMSDSERLLSIAHNDAEPAVRYIAIAALRDPAMLRGLQQEGGSLGRLAECTRGLLELEAQLSPARIRLSIERGHDDVLYHVGPPRKVIRGEWVRGTVTLEHAGDRPRSAAGRPAPVSEVVWVQEWAMPLAISADETASTLDPVIDADAFLANVRAALAMREDPPLPPSSN